ncbi:hypothetical protein [Haloarchaeobius iranensis]|uniref:Uncharacterized protein n=1 Tax=Haloarchaeobius iranensis TaxID=996166 RepID=A0A1G9YGG5_9EURY|nr:hypothetical protein [Haloarchaeobius iranensis]SDN07573.1 hypothetical protein SAMN05192554_11429 [Haloarchaeobius iranensis]
MRRRALLVALAVGLAGCSGRDEPAESTTNRVTTTHGTTVQTTASDTPTRTRTEQPEPPTETTDEPTETVVVEPGDGMELNQGPITLGEFVGPQANFGTWRRYGGRVLGGDNRIYAVFDADLSDYDSRNIIAGSQCEVTVNGDPIPLEYAELGVDFSEHLDGRGARLGAPLPVGEVPETAALLFYGSDRRYRLPIPEHVRTAMAQTPDLSVTASIPETIATADDSAEVDIEFLMTNDGDRSWTLDYRVDHDRIVDGGWSAQRTVPPGEQRRPSLTVWVPVREAQEVTIDASWGFGNIERTVPIERES